MQRSVRRKPIRKPLTFPHLRDEFTKDGKTYREHIEGVVGGEDEKTGLTIVTRVVSAHRVRLGPRVPEDRLKRTRGKHRRIGLNP